MTKKHRKLGFSHYVARRIKVGMSELFKHPPGSRERKLELEDYKTRFWDDYKKTQIGTHEKPSQQNVTKRCGKFLTWDNESCIVVTYRTITVLEQNVDTTKRVVTNRTVTDNGDHYVFTHTEKFQTL